MIRKALVKRGGQIVEVTIDDSIYKDGGSHGGLDRWFAEEWVDIKTGKPCGRQEGENRKGYPACRPSKRVSSETPKTASELSQSEKAKFKRSKQSSSRIPYQHKRRQEGGESNDKEMIDGIADILSQVEDMNNRKKIARNMLTDFRNEDVSFNYQDFLANSGLPELKSGGNKPTNPALWSRAKALARSKFDVYPSAYANGWAAKWYKGKGGGWRKAQMGGEESDQMEEILDQIENALEQGAQPEEILQQLIEMGVDEKQAQALVQEAIQDLQEDAQEENNGDEKEIEEAQKGKEIGNERKRNFVSKSDYEKMQSEKKQKKEIEEKKAIEQKAIRESKYYNNPSSLRNYDPIKFNDPNIQTNVKKECRSGEYVWEYQPCPEEKQTTNMIEKPEGTYSNSPTGKYYYVNLPNSGLGISDEVQINPRELQRYFDNYNLKYSGSGSSAYGDAPINANLMYDPNLPVGEYYDLNQSYNGEPVHYYNTPNAQFFPDTNKEYGGNVDMFGNGGSYRVYKTSERKGKTHKVVGPGGVTKYFGDPKLGERSKSKYGKKGFYARHKKNLAKNPFFRAYARATWAEGGEPTFMQEPEFKTNSFVDLIKSEAENNAYKNIMNQAQEMFMQMGGMTDYGYTGPSKFLDMYEQNLNDLQSKGNVENAVLNGLNQFGLAIEGAGQMVANVVAPGSGALVKAVMDAKRPKSITDPTSKGFSAEGIGSMLKGLASNPEALAGLVARYGGSLPRFQFGGSEFDGSPTQIEGSFLDPNAPVAGGALPDLSWWDSDQNNLALPKELDKSSSPYPSGNQTIPLASPSKPKTQMPGGGIDLLSIGKDIVTAMGNRGKAKKAEAEMADMTVGDNVFAAVETLNRGDFERNTGRLKPDQYIMGTTQGVPALARYGGNLRRAKHGGVQKDGVYLSYPTATPESVVYGEQPKKPSNTLRPVKREFANLEAEDGETVMTTATDGLPKFFKIGGNRHSQGGTPLNLPDGSFIFSDTRSMKIGGDILEELGIKGKKKRTPAEISKILGKGYEKFVMIIQDPNSDKIERRTAELMIENQIKKLGQLALAQEAKKGFPEGIPMIAVPYMESVGIAPEQILPQPQMGMEEMGMPQQMPMAKYGMQKYQTGREKQTNPLITSSPSTPDNPNISQRILGPLSNYFASKPQEEETPIEANVQPVEIFAPVKGFESMEDLDEFISKGDEFGQDFNALYNDYSETIKTIDQLRTGLIEGWIPLEEYEQYKEGINSRIGEIKTEIDESKERLPYSSWSIIPGSTANKLADLSDILDEEKEKLEFRASDLKKFRNFQNNVSFLETEKQNILELLNSDIDNLVRMRLKRRLTDLNDALNYETDRTNQFGERAFKTFSTNTSETSADAPVIATRNGVFRGTLVPGNIYGDIGSNSIFGPISQKTRKFTYDDYLKQYESSPITSKAKPSYETQQGSLNAVQDTVPTVQDTVPAVAAPVSAPAERKVKTEEKKTETKKKNKVTFSAEDLNDIQIINQ